MFLVLRALMILSFFAPIVFSTACGNGSSGGGERGAADDDDNNDVGDDNGDDEGAASIRIVGVEVDDGTRFRVMNRWDANFTGDLWPSAWGADDRLYAANGDGLGFGLIASDIVVNVVDGRPPAMQGRALPGARGAAVAGLWGPEIYALNRKPTGMTCVDGDLYLFFQNLATQLSDDAYGFAPNASISASRDAGDSWEYDAGAPMFHGFVFTTGFFLDYGRCGEQAIDDFVYVYGVDGNWGYSGTFAPTELFLAQVPRDRLLDRAAWRFFAGLDGAQPVWTDEIADKAPVLVDKTIYTNGWTGGGQGSVVFIPALNRYLYSTRTLYEWIFHEAPRPWGPWTKVTVWEWPGEWTEQYHPGYAVTVPSKFLDEDGLGGWIVSTLYRSAFEGMYYNMNFRRFAIKTAKQASRRPLPVNLPDAERDCEKPREQTPE